MIDFSFYLQSYQRWIKSLSYPSHGITLTSSTVTSPSDSFLSLFFTLKDPCVYIGPTQGNLFISRYLILRSHLQSPLFQIRYRIYSIQKLQCIHFGGLLFYDHSLSFVPQRFKSILCTKYIHSVPRSTISQPTISIDSKFNISSNYHLHKSPQTDHHWNHIN